MLSIEQEVWGMTPEGEGIIRYRMRNEQGAEVELTNLGAAVTALRMPDREGKMADVLLGYEAPEEYGTDYNHLGTAIGRYAGTIAYGRMELGGEEYRLENNEGRHHCDGGSKGLHCRLWESRVEENRVVMECASPAGESGWPANLFVQLIFDFDDENRLEITWRAAADGECHLNLSNYLYLNLEGEAGGSALEHELELEPVRWMELNNKLLPTGRLVDVEAGALDFSKPRTLVEAATSEEYHIDRLEGYDHHFMRCDYKHHILQRVGVLRAPRSGRKVEISSSYPALRLSTGNSLSNSRARSKSGHHYRDHEGILLAPMYLPDSPNHPEFPSTHLEAGELYCEKSVFHFQTE